MSSSIALLLCGTGLAALYYGAEWLVRGVVHTASALRVRPLIIGLTVVAFATSMPEAMISMVAGAHGYSDIVTGNIIGSNIVNVGFVLAAAAIIRPFPVSSKLLRRAVPFMVVVTLVFYGLAWRLVLGRWTGAAFLLALVSFSILLVGWARREGTTVPLEKGLDEPIRSGNRHRIWLTCLALVAAGLMALFAGAYLLVYGAVVIAHSAGISERVIGATLVAVGSALPELATSIVAAWRRQVEVSLGNLVGSNYFNILGALGLSTLVHPVRINPSMLRFEFPVLMAFTIAMAVVLRAGRQVSRLEGALLLLGYAAFVAALFSR
jgi:cation:H+ antiporter